MSLSSLLKHRTISITVANDNNEKPLVINGTVREASVGEYVAIAEYVIEFIKLSNLESELDVAEIFKVVSKLITSSPEILARIDMMIDLKMTNENGNVDLVPFSFLPMNLSGKVLLELKEVNRTFLDLMLVQLENLSKEKVES
jgi:hypothetical protein